MVRAVIRWTLRGIKGVLALIALAALFLWPWSYLDPDRLGTDRWTIGTERAEARFVGAAWSHGGIGLNFYVTTFPTMSLALARERAAAIGPGWIALDCPGDVTAVPIVAYSSWGPLYFSRVLWRRGDILSTWRNLSLPCWLLSLLAGAWPFASVALFVRRRRRVRRRARAGLCRRCGYDLRATPAAGGDLLAVCPECGRAADGAAPPTH